MLHGRYKRVDKIGEGSYGVVYKYIDQNPTFERDKQKNKTEDSKDTFKVPNSFEDIKSKEPHYVAIKKLRSGKVFMIITIVK